MLAYPLQLPDKAHGSAETDVEQDKSMAYSLIRFDGHSHSCVQQALSETTNNINCKAMQHAVTSAGQ